MSAAAPSIAPHSATTPQPALVVLQPGEAGGAASKRAAAPAPSQRAQRGTYGYTLPDRHLGLHAIPPVDDVGLSRKRSCTFVGGSDDDATGSEGLDVEGARGEPSCEKKQKTSCTSPTSPLELLFEELLTEGEEAKEARVGEGEVVNWGGELKELSELLPDVLDTNMLQLAGGEELRDVDEQQLLDTSMLQLAGGEEDMLQFAAMLVRPVTLTQPYPCPYPDPYPYPKP